MDKCNNIKHRSVLLTGIKHLRRFTSIDDCRRLQSDIYNSVRNNKKRNVVKMEVIYLSRKINMLTFNCDLDKCGILDTDCFNDLGVFLDSKLPSGC
jgi:hypothetical protein